MWFDKRVVPFNEFIGVSKDASLPLGLTPLFPLSSTISSYMCLNISCWVSICCKDTSAFSL